MSPKSRGRPPGRGRSPRKRHGAVRTLTPADRVLRAAGQLSDVLSRLYVEQGASQWLGDAWTQAPIGSRSPERELVDAVVSRLDGGSGPIAFRALQALRLVASADDQRRVDEALAAVAVTLPEPGWATPAGWAPERAWRGADAYDGERVLLVEYDGLQPHALLFHILTVGGLMVDEIVLLDVGSLEDVEQTLEFPMAECGAEDASAEAAEALATTDMYWPRRADPAYSALRALAHARTRDHRREPPDWEPMTDDVRQGLIDEFLAAVELDRPEETVRLLADLFLDFGDGYLIAGALAWSPEEVERFLLDWVPRKTVLDAEDRDALPDVLRVWVAFALRRRGLAEDDIELAVDVVAELEDDFREAFDDEAAFGPGKQVMMALLERGVDLTDRDVVQDAVRAYNAEQLARRLTDES